MPLTKSSPKPKPNRLHFEAIGTHWSIEVFGEQQIGEQLKLAIHQRIEVFDKHYSRFRADSLVTEMSRHSGEYKLPADAKPMFDLYRQLYDLSGGAVTPLIGQTLSDAGYDASYSLDPKKLQSPPDWGEVLEYSYPKLKLQRPVLLDLGALGKGYLVDIVASLLEKAGYHIYCVDAGGDMLYRGSNNQPIQVGLEHPDDPTQVIGVVELHNQALCGSAGNRRAWANYHHIIDPKKLTSPQHIKALWVTADSTMLADGLATALFFVSPEVLARRYTFEYAIIFADASLQHSNSFPAQFFTSRGV